MDRLIFLENHASPSKFREIPLADFLTGSVGSGWHPLITDLCLKLWSLGWDGRVAQCKEKFGGLRFYLASGSDITDQMWELVTAAERASLSVCETCGTSPANLRKDRWWLKTLCDKCDTKSRNEHPDQYSRNPESVPDNLNSY